MNQMLIENKKDKLRVNGKYTNKDYFPAGEYHAKISVNDDDNLIYILDYHDDKQFVEMLMDIDAVKRQNPNIEKMTLIIPYLPYARQDRVCNEGESFSLKVIGDLINSVGFDNVITNDVHSEVAFEYVKNLESVDQNELFEDHCRIFANNIPNLGIQNFVRVCPDKGALKKIPEDQQKDVIICEKVRDPKSGEITGTEVQEFDVDKNYVIVDDICDGGRTFIEIAKKMRQMGLKGKLRLWTTHGIYSKGLEVLQEHFDHVMCHNSVGYK